MDIYIILCFAAVFAALVEFACINFIDTFIKRFRYVMLLESFFVGSSEHISIDSFTFTVDTEVYLSNIKGIKTSMENIY